MRTRTWIFGYGSLIWRPEFPHIERRPAFIRGWSRRFWQGSTDHRGVPERPGRVVTLVPEPEGACWGMAYRLDPAQSDDVLAALDWRERGGYQRHVVSLHFERDAARAEPGIMYVATPANPNYLGPADLAEIALQVRTAHGPSGANPEYVLRLAEALRAMAVEDVHVFALERLLRDGTP